MAPGRRVDCPFPFSAMPKIENWRAKVPESPRSPSRIGVSDLPSHHSLQQVPPIIIPTDSETTTRVHFSHNHFLKPLPTNASQAFHRDLRVLRGKYAPFSHKTKEIATELAFGWIDVHGVLNTRLNNLRLKYSLNLGVFANPPGATPQAPGLC